jgi:hypothetical protein
MNEDRPSCPDDRRIAPRTVSRFPVKFRIVREGNQMQVSEPVEGTLRDLSETGLAMETLTISVDGLHISYNDHPARKNRVYLQWEFQGGKSIKAVGETIWYERISTAGPRFVVGLRFVEMTPEDRTCLMEFLGATRNAISI